MAQTRGLIQGLLISFCVVLWACLWLLLLLGGLVDRFLLGLVGLAVGFHLPQAAI